MVILDTNIFIYMAQGKLSPRLIAKKDIAHASVTKIEALGFSALPVNELLLLTSLFNESYDLPLDDNVVARAIHLRQAKRMALGDAIVAATALAVDLELWTANSDDFNHIDELKLFNPMC